MTSSNPKGRTFSVVSANPGAGMEIPAEFHVADRYSSRAVKAVDAELQTDIAKQEAAAYLTGKGMMFTAGLHALSLDLQEKTFGFGRQLVLRQTDSEMREIMAGAFQQSVLMCNEDMALLTRGGTRLIRKTVNGGRGDE